jgi:hypothetical protein
MVAFTDALRGYALSVHRRDDFRLAVKRGVTFDARSPEELVAQRLPYVEATRSSYRTFWEEHVHAPPSAAPT